MKYNFDEFRDKQQDLPDAYCSHCQGEIYELDDCYIINGHVICSYCLEDFEKEIKYSIKGYELEMYLNSFGGLDDIE